MNKNKLSHMNLINNEVKNIIPNFEEFEGNDIQTFQKKIAPSSPSNTNNGYNFGTEFIFQPSKRTNCLVNNFILKIKLSKLMESIIPLGNQGNSFNIYTNSIAYSIIESLELKLGTEVIISKKIPYDVLLDLLNEYHDPNRNGWSLVQKFESLNSIKQQYSGGVTNDLLLYVPLRVWCDKSINTAIPLYLLENLTNPITITIKTKNFNELRIFNVSSIPPANYDPNLNPLIEECELLYDEHQFTVEMRDKLNTIYNSTNDYEIFFDNYYSQIDIPPTPTTAIPPPAGRFAFSHILENYSVKIDGLDIVEGPLKEVFFLFRNTRRIQSPTSEALVGDLPEIRITPGDYFNYSIVDNYYQPIENFEKLTIIQNLNTEPFIEDVESEYLKKVVPYLNKPNVPRKNIYSFSFERKGLNNFYKYTYDNPLTFKFLNIFFEYEFKSLDPPALAAPQLPFSYQIVSLLRFTSKLNISSKGYIQLDNWGNTLNIKEPKEVTEQIENISGLTISDVAKSIMIDIVESEPLVYVDTLNFTENFEIQLTIFSNKSLSDLTEIFRKNVLVFKFYTKIAGVFYLVKKLIKSVKTLIASGSDSKELTIIKGRLKEKGITKGYEITIYPHFTNACKVKEFQLIEKEFYTEKDIKNYYTLITSNLKKEYNNKNPLELSILYLKKNTPYFNACKSFTGLNFYAYLEIDFPLIVKGSKLSYVKDGLEKESFVNQINETNKQFIMDNGDTVNKSELKSYKELNELCKKAGVLIGKDNKLILNLSSLVNNNVNSCMTIVSMFNQFKAQFETVLSRLRISKTIESSIKQSCIAEYKNKFFLKQDKIQNEGIISSNLQTCGVIEDPNELLKKKQITDLQNKIKFSLNLEEAAFKKYRIKLNDKTVTNISQLQGIKLLAIDYTIRGQFDKVIKFTTA